MVEQPGDVRTGMGDEDKEGLARLGNAGEYCDLTYVGLESVAFKPGRDWKLMCNFAEARGSQAERLGDL